MPYSLPQRRKWLLALCGSLLAFSLCAPAQAQRKQFPSSPIETNPFVAPEPRVPTSGTYTDATGAKHAWAVNEQHALMWDNAPYIPVGGKFTPRSLSASTEASWQEDAKALANLKEKGIRDLLIWCDKSLTEMPAPALQRLISYLDANEFRYGLSFGNGMTAPLTGIVVKPASYRYDTREDLTAQWTIPNADSALFYLYDVTNGKLVVENAAFSIPQSILTVPIEPPPGAGHTVALVYPHKVFKSGRGSLPDIWSGFDTYRDGVLAYLRQIKFGGGLRFFHDPLSRSLGLEGERDFLIPDSSNFRLEFEAWLSHQYPSVEELKTAWALLGADFKNYAQMAQLLPLWANGRGLAYYYDPLKRRSIGTDMSQSRWWNDFVQFRNESILYYMNTMANILKRNVANVPVVYTWTQQHPVFLNPDAEGGYDGLSVALQAGDITNLSHKLAPAYSAVEQAKRNLWSLVTEVEGDANAVAIQTDLNLAKKGGSKGYFFGDFQPSRGADWLQSAEALTSLVGFQSGVSNAQFATEAPPTLTFPQFAPGLARYGLVPGTTNVLWLGKYVMGDNLNWWPSFMGYTLGKGGARTRYVIQSLRGTRKVHFQTLNPKNIFAFHADGTPIPIKITSKVVMEIVIDERPVIIVPNNQELFPVEAALDAVTQLKGLVQYATDLKVVSGAQAKATLDVAEASFSQNNFERAFEEARRELDELIIRTSPYVWLEGESTQRHTFTETSFDVEASQGAYLSLATTSTPSVKLPYGAVYTFDVMAEGKYNLWLAGSIPGKRVSPITWYVNADPAQPIADARPIGTRYKGQEMGWIFLGSARLRKGLNQRLAIRVEGPNEEKEYRFGIDAILMTTSQVAPNLVVRPLPIDIPLGQEGKIQAPKKRRGGG